MATGCKFLSLTDGWVLVSWHDVLKSLETLHKCLKRSSFMTNIIFSQSKHILKSFHNFTCSTLGCCHGISAVEFTLYSWVSLGYFAISLSGGQLKVYWWLCCTGVKKSHEIAHICCQTQGQHLQWKNYFPLMTVHRVGVDPQWNYDVTWNPRICN